MSGTIEVTASLENVGNPTVPLSAFGARRMEFTLDGAPLLTDFEDPWTFQLPTTYFADGTYTLALQATLRDGFTDSPNHVTAPVSITLTFDNGIEAVPPTGAFQPTSGRPTAEGSPFVLAATGDGPSGEFEATAGSDLIHAWDPNMFLFLGDVNEDGTRRNSSTGMGPRTPCGGASGT